MNGRKWMGCLALCVTLLVSACGLPEGDLTSPEGAYYTWVQARQKGDIDGCWQVMHPEVRGYLERWNQFERDTLLIVEMPIYPKSHRAAALEIMDVERARLPDGKALFAHLLTRDGGQPLEMLQALGARVSTVDQVDQETVALTTLGGDRVTVKRIDDTWSFSLTDESLQALAQLVEKAEANLARADANKKRLRGVVQGVQSESPSGQ